jgi:nitrogen-specific signal transduction histidine kinase
LVPKEMGNGSTRPSKKRLALNKRQKQVSTPLARSQNLNGAQKALSELKNPIQSIRSAQKLKSKIVPPEGGNGLTQLVIAPNNTSRPLE